MRRSHFLKYIHVLTFGEIISHSPNYFFFKQKQNFLKAFFLFVKQHIDSLLIDENGDQINFKYYYNKAFCKLKRLKK